MPKRITWLINDITQFGGIERVVCNVSNYLHNQGYVVKIVSLNTKTGKAHFGLSKDIEITHLNYPTEDNLKRKQLKTVIKAFLQQEDSDILITCHPWIAMPVIQCKRKYKGKVICTEHSTWSSYSKARRTANVLFYRRAKKFVLLTEDAKNTYRKYGLKNIVVIPNFISDLPTKSAKLQNKELITAGRLVDIKGYDRIIEAAKLIRDDLKPWHISIYGEGENEKQLRRLIKQYRLDDTISICGFTDKLQDKLQNCSGFIVSSHNEAFPMVVLESLSNGVPVISFDIPSLREIDRNTNTIIFAKQDNIDDFANTILSYTQKDNLSESGKAARKLSEQYTLKSIGKQWIDLIESI